MTPSNTTTRRILVVDDNPAIHADFRKIFCPAEGVNQKLDNAEATLFGEATTEEADSAFELDFAFQGQEALVKVRQAWNEGCPYMMAFIDVRMPPGWDGIETTTRLWEVDPHLQVVICTAYSDYSWKQVTNTLRQPDRFVILKKPFEIVEVQQMANAFTEKWQLLRQVEERTRRVEASEKRYHFLADAMPAIVWTARPDGNVDYFNKRLEEFSARNPVTLNGFGWNEMVHPEDLAQCVERWADSCRTGQDYEAEYRLKRSGKDTYRWHLARGVPMRDESGRILQWVGTCIDIEDQKQAEEALRHAQTDLEQRVVERTQELAAIRARLEHLLRSSPVIIYCARPGPSEHMVFISDNISHMLGYQPGEFTNNPRFWLEHIHPDERAKMPDYQSRLLATGHQPVEYRFQHRDGSYRWIHDDARVIRDARGNIVELIGSWVDVTERKKAEEALRQSEERIRMLVASVKDYAIFMLDPEGRIASWNGGAEHIKGHQAHEILGQHFSVFYPPEETASGRPGRLLTTAAADGRVEDEGWRLRKDGSQFWASIVITAVRDESGQLRGYSNVTRDITRQKNAEKERQLMEVQLRQTQKLETIGQLAAGIAHEINTPIQYVGDNTRFLKDSFDSIALVLRTFEELLPAAKNGALAPGLIARAEELLAGSDLAYLFEQIPAAIRETLEGVERVSKIVRAMKEFSHPGGKEKTPADLNKAIETTVTVARNEWKYVADVVFELDPALPPVPCFIGEFNQVILNLVVNAAHAIGDVVKTNPGSKGRITVGTRVDDQHVEIRVRDTGTGIPEAARPKIFEPFFTTKEVGKGTGQGLSIVYGSMVKKHGGSVRFETEMGQGTTFILRLPMVPTTAGPEPSAPAPVRPAAVALPVDRP